MVGVAHNFEAGESLILRKEDRDELYYVAPSLIQKVLKRLLPCISPSESLKTPRLVVPETSCFVSPASTLCLTPEGGSFCGSASSEQDDKDTPEHLNGKLPVRETDVCCRAAVFENKTGKIDGSMECSADMAKTMVDDLSAVVKVAPSVRQVSVAASDDPPELGDIVCLGKRAPSEFRGFSAVVTEIANSHCTVAVLDDDRRYGVGTCWPFFADLSVESRDWRLGKRVVIRGMKGGTAKKLNGFSGVIVRHPRQGHPSFVCKPAQPERPQLVVCLLLDDPEGAGQKSVLLEPRYLSPLDSFLDRIAEKLGDAAAAISLHED